MLHNNKGLSEIVSYVLLIVIVLAIAGLVFSWTKSIIPKDKEECPEVSIIISDYNCSNNSLTLELTNKGLFDVDGWYARVYDKSGRVLPLKDNGESKTIMKMNVSAKITKEYNYEGEIKSIEIEPFVGDILCSKAIVKQDINC